MRTKANRRGLTLIELIVAMAVMLVAVAAATTLMIAAMRMARDRTGNVEAAERARLASAEMLENLERAGLGSSTQLTVNIGSTPTAIMPIFTIDNSTGANPGGNGPNPIAGTDEIWMVTPARLALGEPCWDPGAKTPLTSAQVGTNVTVACNAGFSSYTGAGRFVMLLSGQGTGKAGLLSAPGTSGGNTVTSTDATFINGYGPGDSLVGVQVLHYYIGLNPNDIDPDGTRHPALYRAYGALGTTATTPFQNAANPAPVPEIPDVEDLQLVTLVDTTGQKNPATYIQMAPMPPTPLIALPAQVKGMRVTLVARSHVRSQRDGQAVPWNQAFAPLTVENHVPGLPADGYERVIFSRRVEMPNMAMTSF